MRPASRSAILAASLSTQTTSLPRSAKTAPVTNPTYPVPTTQMFMTNGTHDSRQAAGDDEKPRPDWRIYVGTSSGRRRTLVVAVVVVAEMLAGVAHGVGQGIEALTGDRDRVALLVPGLPHPLTPMAPHRHELYFHSPGVCKILHVLGLLPRSLRPTALAE